MKITGTFKTEKEHTIRVTFYNKRSTLPSININTSDDIFFGDEPVIITNEADDTFAHILRTQAKVTLVARSWLGDYLFADNAKSIVVNIWKDDVCIFAGYCSPNSFNQNYSHELEPIEINCVDTLTTLQNRRLTDDNTYEELVAQSSVRPFSWFFGKMNLEDPAGVIPNLPDYPVEEMHIWVETSWTRMINNETNEISYYAIESECVVLDEETAVATGDTRIGSYKTPTYIQSEDTCIVDGIQYYKKYAWITVNGEQTNTGDWIVGDPTGDMPYVVRQETRLTGWTTGVLPQPFDFWEHMTTFDVYSNGMEIAVSDGIGEQIPETPQTTTNGSYYEFRQGSADDVDVDEDTGYIYYKDYAWVCVNNECTNSGQWQRGAEKSHPAGTHTAITGWQYNDPAVAFEYYETISHYIDYSDGTSELDYTTMGHQIPLTPSTTPNGSYYEYIDGQTGDYYTDPDTGFVYFKEYAWVTVNNVMERTNDWRRGDWIEQLNGQLYGKLINSASTAPTITVVKNNVTTNYQPVYNYTTNEFVIESNVIPDGISSITFSDKANIEKLIFLDIDTSSMTDMHNMFKQFTNLKSLNLGSFDTSNVTDMNNMFYVCTVLEEINFPATFDTSNVTNMTQMFYYCRSLISLDVTGFDTSSVTNMGGMFSGCESLASLDVTGFYTSNVTEFGGMFDDCISLTTIDVSHFNTSSATGMGSMFATVDSITALDLSNFDTSDVTDMRAMFRASDNLTTLNLSNFDMTYVDQNTMMYEMFKNCNELDTLILNNVSNDTFNKITMRSRTNLPTAVTIYRDNYVYKYNSNTSQWEAVNKIYGTAISTQTTAPTITLNNTTYTADVWNDTTKEFGFTNVPTNVTSIGQLSNIFETLVFTKYIDTSNATSLYNVFHNCESLTALDISHFNTSNVTNMYYMLGVCTSLTSLDLSNFNTSSVTNMMSMFQSCTSLTSLNISNWEVGTNTSTTNMFYRTTALTSITMNNVSNDTFNTIGAISHIHVSRITIYRDGDAYKWNSSTSQWEIQS